MSAYIVDNITINRIVAMLHEATEFGGEEKRYPKPQNELLIVNYDNEADFGEILYCMNRDAVMERYQDDKEGTLPGQKSPFTFQPMMADNPLQTLKTLQCYLYQCTEGVTVEKHLYKALNQFADEIAIHIVESLPEYKQAKWA